MYTLLFCRFSYCFVLQWLREKNGEVITVLSVPILIIEDTVTAMYFSYLRACSYFFARMNQLNIGVLL